MRNTPNLKAERHRVAGSSDMGNNGGFAIPQPSGHDLKVQVSDGGGWDHVSVSTPFRCPSWAEMEAVRRLFFRDDEWAIQYGVPATANINFHNYCLHWWRPQCVHIPRPPSFMVGPTPELAAFARSACGELCLPWEQAHAINQMMEAAPDLYAACLKAKQFIANGIEFGYIRLPDEGDSALETLPLILSALAKAEGRS